MFTVTAALVGFPHIVAAHTQAVAVREIVRLRGTVATPESSCKESEVSVRALARTLRLCGSEIRRIATAAADIDDQASLPVAFDLQGEREPLALILGASAGTRISILAEWRPGRRDLFLIDADLCACGEKPTE